MPIDVLFEYPVVKNVWLGLGANGYIIASAGYVQSETLQEPASLTFENGSRTRDNASGSLTGYNTAVFNGIGSLRFRLVERMSSISGIDLLLGYVLPLTSVFEPQTWTSAAGNPPTEYSINKYKVSMFTAGLMFAF